MKKLMVFALILLTASKIGFSQEEKKHSAINYIFDPKADAQRDIDDALVKAKAQKKRVLMVVGGDWDHYSTRCVHYLPKYDNLYWSNYLLVKVCYDPNNKNREVLAKYGCPIDHGFPVLLILDDNGKVLKVAPTDGHKETQLDIEGAFVLQLLTDYAPQKPNSVQSSEKKKPLK